jgi:YjbE family integral membrane protein
MEAGTPEFWLALAQIMMINVLLSGDNAVVIALASRNLPPKEQKWAILIGSAGAILALVVLAFFAVKLLELHYVKLVGSALLLWVGIKLLVPEDEGDDLDAAGNLMGAVKTIIIADVVMSLDNVIGMTGAAKGSMLLLCIGLAVSTPVIIFGSTLLMKLMDRFPIIITIGGGLLGYVAGEMVLEDGAIESIVHNYHWLHTVLPILGAAGVVAVGKYLASRHPAEQHAA